MLLNLLNAGGSQLLCCAVPGCMQLCCCPAHDRHPAVSAGAAAACSVLTGEQLWQQSLQDMSGKIFMLVRQLCQQRCQQVPELLLRLRPRGESVLLRCVRECQGPIW